MIRNLVLISGLLVGANAFSNPLAGEWKTKCTPSELIKDSFYQVKYVFQKEPNESGSLSYMVETGYFVEKTCETLKKDTYTSQKGDYKVSESDTENIYNYDYTYTDVFGDVVEAYEIALIKENSLQLSYSLSKSEDSRPNEVDDWLTYFKTK